MDSDSPDAIRDFPGLYLYSAEAMSSDCYNDEVGKKEIMGKRKEKKDKKDKGYAALEGESSDEASPCKAKKTKALFSKSKNKEKDKEPPIEKPECGTKMGLKKKARLQKFPRGFGSKVNAEETRQDLADALPIFGVNLEDACQRGKCHDGVNIPLPVRECIDYLEAQGMSFENVYKNNGQKNKVNHIKKMYNNRQPVPFNDIDVPTATSILKAFLRELPEPIFTSELLPRFEEAGAILNYQTREKHLNSLIHSLPTANRELVTWLVIHFHNVTQKEDINKMNKQSLAQALNHTLHISSRLLQALITHRDDIFPGLEIIEYIPPLEAGCPYPDDPDEILRELAKLGSALDLIHLEMQQGFFSDLRQEQLWELQRVETELKRKLKKALSKRDSLVTAKPLEVNVNPITPTKVAEEETTVTECDAGEALPTLAVTTFEIDVEDTLRSEEHRILPSEIKCEFEEAEEKGTSKVTEYERIESNAYCEEGEEPFENSGPTLCDSGSYRHWDLGETEYERLFGDIPLESATEKNSEYQFNPPNDFMGDSRAIETNPRDIRVRSNAGCGVAEKILVENNVTELNEQMSVHEIDAPKFDQQYILLDRSLITLQAKNNMLMELIESLSSSIQQEKSEVEKFQRKLERTSNMKKVKFLKFPRNFEVKKLLIRENHMLEIKKVELVRQIMEQREQCINLQARMQLLQLES